MASRRSPFAHGPLSLYDPNGNRLWLTPAERAQVLQSFEPNTPLETFGAFLVYTGCRLSEALSVRVSAFDFQEHTVRLTPVVSAQGVSIRAVPLPESYLERVAQLHELRVTKQRKRLQDETRLWPWSRMTAWRRVKEAMEHAGVRGPQATAKGIRHGFGVAAVQAGVPLEVLKQWMGHAEISSTVIYVHGPERDEQTLMAPLWKSLKKNRPTSGKHRRSGQVLQHAGD